MAELLQTLQELQAVPEDAHWFCPRNGEEDQDRIYFDEDLLAQGVVETRESKNARLKRLLEFETRKQLALDSLQILAFDGPDAAPYKEWLEQRLIKQMSSCELCIRIFHRTRSDLKQRLEEQYDEEEVKRFLEILDQMNIDRIKKGLDLATAALLKLPPDQRGIDTCPTAGLYAIFETLSCRAFLQDERLIEQHFDEPFQLTQTKKRLRLTTYVPALTYFLFSRNDFRQRWAYFTWKKMKRNLTMVDFEWAIQEPLLKAMYRVQLNSMEADFLPLFWQGCRLLVARMDSKLITHSLRSLEIDVCKLALEHLHLDFEDFRNLLATFQMLLEKCPRGFWDAMGAISAGTIIEQVFNNRAFQRCFVTFQVDDHDYNLISDLVAWINPFLASIKAGNLAPACRKLIDQLMNRMQSDKFHGSARYSCTVVGMKVLSTTLARLNEGCSVSTFAGPATVLEILEIVKQHLVTILPETRQRGQLTEAVDVSLQVVQRALALDCLSLAIDREYAARDNAPVDKGRHDMKTDAHPIWAMIVQSISAGDIVLATRVLAGSRTLIGLEPFLVKGQTSLPPPKISFNEALITHNRFVTEVIERMADASQEDLREVFADPAYSEFTLSPLFSSDQLTRQAAIGLLKTFSLETGRREALAEIMGDFLANTLSALARGVRNVAQRKVFAPMSSMLKLSTDVVDVLCDPQEGLLRTRTLQEDEAGAAERFWATLWTALTVIFETTEAWSTVGHEKNAMMDFCRDTMQFADKLFDQYNIVAGAIRWAKIDKLTDEDRAQVGVRLLEEPQNTFGKMVKWLRLRDEYLASKSVSLISKLLIKLKVVNVSASDESLIFIGDIITGKIRAKLSPQQNAELESALERHTGKSLFREDQTKIKKQGKLNWAIKEESKTTVTRSDVDETDKLIKSVSSTAEAFKARLANRTVKAESAPKKSATFDTAAAENFRKQREKAKEDAQRKRLQELAKAKEGLVVKPANQIADAGSGLKGLGVMGKDHTVRGQGVMVSSDEESETDEEMDDELFGSNRPKLPKPARNNPAKLPSLPQGPVKKVRQVRSARDMRARLAPDLTNLHREILGWDYFHEGDFPPGSRADSYAAVPNTFQTPHDYESTFRPLLTLEAWQGFVKAREEQTFKAFEIKISNRSSVDKIMEVGSSMTHADNKEIQISEGDIVLLSKASTPATSPGVPSCLARVNRIVRKKNHLEILYRVIPGNPLLSSLNPGTIVYGAKIQSITPLEREFGALVALKFYDLCDEICKAKPSPMLNYTEKTLQPFINTYNLNLAQAKAVKSAIDNDAFTLIQGPPGSGKTKTIVAIVGALLTEGLRDKNGTTIQRPGLGGLQSQDGSQIPKKLLVCAPSNAAVDELVMRFKEGVKTTNGVHKKINVVRLGRSDAINANVLDVTLDQLVSAKLSLDTASGKNMREDTQKIMKEHQAVSEKLRETREALTLGDVKGDDAKGLKDDFDALKQRQRVLGAQIDDAKDREKTMDRQAELNRRRAQQQVLDGAHVICATLSGSGHEMFQNLNIEFETVVVDEAAQCVEMSALIPLKYGCAKCVLVGDPKQLPPTVFSKEAARFQYEQSLFVRMQGNHPNDVHLLDTQYRMHPEISLFPSRAFYDSKLLDGGDMAAQRQRPWHASALLGPYRFFDVQGQHQAAPKGHSLINIAEIEVALQLYDRLTTDFSKIYNFHGKIGIITPYKSQLRELKGRFAQRYGPTITENIDFNTTDAFQGRESEIIIFSCVRASPAGGIGFLQDIRRMNVGLTRAKSSLWVLGNSHSLVRGEFWRKLVEDSQSRDRLTQGNILSMLKKSNTSAIASSPVTVESRPVTPRLPLQAIHTRDSDISVISQESATQGSESRRSSTSSVSTLPADVKARNEKHGKQPNSRLASMFSRADADMMDIDVQVKKRKLSYSADMEDVKMDNVQPISQPVSSVMPIDKEKTQPRDPAPPAPSAPLRPAAVPPRKKREADPFLPKQRRAKPKPN